MTVKGCLKATPVPSRANSRENLTRHDSSCSGKKCVSFCDDGCDVWIADVWDRTPTEPTKNLSYQDMLEFKAILKSLPRAVQRVDPWSRRAPVQLLSSVPIGLLPLLPSDDPPVPPSSPPPSPSSENCSPDLSDTGSPPESTTPSLSSPVTESPPLLPSPPVTYTPPSSLFPHGIPIQRLSSPSSPTPAAPPSQPSPLLPTPSTIPCVRVQEPQKPPSVLSHLSHLLPARPQPARQKPKFSFLPLLDTPTTTLTVEPPLSPAHTIDVTTTTTTAQLEEEDIPPTPTSTTIEIEEEDCPPTPTSTTSNATTFSSSTCDPPTPSLTNASLDSSPRTSPSPNFSPDLLPYMQLPPLAPPSSSLGYVSPESSHNPSTPTKSNDMDDIPSSYFPAFNTGPPMFKTLSLEPVGSPLLAPVSPFSLDFQPHHYQNLLHSQHQHQQQNQLQTPPLSPYFKPHTPSSLSHESTPFTLISSSSNISGKKKKQVIVVNGIEMELDDDDDDADASNSLPSPCPTPCASEEEQDKTLTPRAGSSCAYTPSTTPLGRSPAMTAVDARV